jgi:hypothetical protein
VNHSTGWIGGEDGTILRTPDGGTTWSHQASGTSATIFSLSFTGAVRGWAAGGSGTILRTVNGGTTDVRYVGREEAGFRLRQNVPNPFNGSTIIRYSIPVSCRAVLTLHDGIGRMVSMLVDEFIPPGEYSFNIESVAAHLPTGVYYYRLQAGPFFAVRAMVLVR